MGFERSRLKRFRQAVQARLFNFKGGSTHRGGLPSKNGSHVAAVGSGDRIGVYFNWASAVVSGACTVQTIAPKLP